MKKYDIDFKQHDWSGGLQLWLLIFNNFVTLFAQKIF